MGVPYEARPWHRARKPKTPKIRTVLALLIANPNETVFTEHLIEELWGGEVPRSAAGTVQTYIYGSPGMSVGHSRRLLERSCGSCRVMGPQESMTRARAASAL